MSRIRAVTDRRRGSAVLAALAVAIWAGGCTSDEAAEHSVGSAPVPSAATSGSSGPSVGPTDPPATASTAVPASSTSLTTLAGTGGGTGDTVVVVTIPPLPPAPLDEAVADGGGVVFRIVSIEAVQGEASGAGEAAGPALRVTVSAVNDSSAPVGLDGTLVDLRHGPDRIPAAPYTLGATPFSGSVAVGGEATGVYLFDVPLDRRSDIRITVSARPELPAVVFEGPVA